MLVTGGTSGLGFAMSQALAEAGARVALTGRSGARVRDAADQIARRTPVTGVVMDVRDEQSVAAGVDRVRSAFGGLDVLVNNAGIGMRTVNPDFMTSPQGFWQVSPAGFRDLFATNVVGYFLVARAVIPHMLSAGRGKIINISVSETTMVRKGFTPSVPRGHRGALPHHGRRPGRHRHRREPAAAGRRHQVRHDAGFRPGRAARQLARPRDHGAACLLARLAVLGWPDRPARRGEGLRRARSWRTGLTSDSPRTVFRAR